jgi:hypothetical protein
MTVELHTYPKQINVWRHIFSQNSIMRYDLLENAPVFKDRNLGLLYL